MTKLFIADTSAPSGALGAVLAAVRLWEGIDTRSEGRG